MKGGAKVIKYLITFLITLWIKTYYIKTYMIIIVQAVILSIK